MVPRRFHGGLGAFWWKLFSVVLVFVLFSLLIAPLGVLAHHENEAEHQQTALANSGKRSLSLFPEYFSLISRSYKNYFVPFADFSLFWFQLWWWLVTSVTNTVPLDLPSTTAIKKATPPADKMASPPTDLVIETISKPSNAASLRKVTKGDVIKVHYVRLFRSL